jgi:hypothetical protein
LAVSPLKKNARFSQLIDIGGVDMFNPIATEITAHVIHCDE